jgi:metal transporter CNNM
MRVPKGEVVTEPDDTLAAGEENLIDLGEDNKDPQHVMRRTLTHDSAVAKLNGLQSELGTSPRKQPVLRRTSSTQYSSDREGPQRKASKGEVPDHFKRLGPSNLASRPRQTRYNTVKIKPGGGSFSDGAGKPQDAPKTLQTQSPAAQGGIGAGLVSAGKDAKDGVLALQAGYGTLNSSSPPSPKNSRKGHLVALAENGMEGSQSKRPVSEHGSRPGSEDTVGSMKSGAFSPRAKKRPARSGSITENIIDAGGIKKTVLEMTSSSEDHDDGGAQIGADGASDGNDNDGKENSKPGDGSGKKKRRRKKRPAGSKGGEGEDTPLLDDGRD